MYYKKKDIILFRDYEDFGYLTDNRNFGYMKTKGHVIGDKVVSSTGSVFIKLLGTKARTIRDVVNDSLKIFNGVDNIVLANDIKDFFDELVNNGFLVKSEDYSECNTIAADRSSGTIKENEIYEEKEKGPISTQSFLQDYFGDTPFPVSIHLDIVKECNERCVHCFIPHEAKVGIMDYSLFEKILKQVCDMNLLHVTISGGEPMLHPEFEKMLKACRMHNLSVNVLSNLTLLNNNIADEMYKNPLLCVQASVYSMDEIIHDGITCQKGSFRKTKSSIELLNNIGVPIQISCPIMKQNYGSYKDVVEWGSQLGIPVSSDYVIIGRCDSTTNNLHCRLSLDEISNIISEDVKNPSILSEMKDTINKNKLRTMDDYICNVCNSSICVDYQGNVFPCAGWQGCVLGNIQDGSLREIWFDSDKAKYLRGIKRKDFEECLTCEYEDYCTLCMVRNANESHVGNPLDINHYYCEISKIKKQIIESLPD